MKKRWTKILAVMLTLCMLPWQEGYVAYAYGWNTINPMETVTEAVVEENAEDVTEEATEKNVEEATEVSGKTSAIDTEAVTEEETAVDNTQMMPEVNMTQNVMPQETTVVQEDSSNEQTEDENALVVDCDIVLEEDMTIESSVHMTAGKIDLNGYTLTIQGNLIQTGGALIVNNGKLIVNGDFSCVMEDGSFGMTGNGDEIYVQGNWVIDTPYTYMNYGNVEVQGNVYIYDDMNIHNKLICGGNLEVNADVELFTDLSVTGNLVINEGVLTLWYTDTISVMGDFVIMGGEKQGKLYQSSSASGVYVDGSFYDYRTSVEDNYNNNYKGIIEVKGNLEANYFYMATSGEIIFSGEEEQQITIHEDAKFGKIVNQNSGNFVLKANKEISFETYEGETEIAYKCNDISYIKNISLAQDTVLEGNAIILGNSNNLNGYTLTINGNVIVEGSMDFSGGKIITAGDLICAKRSEDSSFKEATGKIQNLNAQTGGNLYINVSYGTIDSIVASGNVELVDVTDSVENLTFCGEKKQEFKLYEEDSSVGGFSVQNLTLANHSGEPVEFVNDVQVYGTLDTNNNPYEGNIRFYGNIESLEDTVYGNLIFENAQTITKELTIHGNISIPKGLEVSAPLTINGELQASAINVNGTKCTINGNLTCNQLTLTNESSHCLVNGTFIHTGNSGAGFGTLELKGDAIINAGMSYQYKTKLLLSGDVYQHIDVNSDSYFENVEVTNTSSDGIYLERAISCKNFVNESSKITYGDNSSVYGWTLTEDLVWEGDFVLMGNVMDLNGHTLTINGNLIHTNGILKINGGTLNINGNYQPQDGTTGTGYDYSQGMLVMDNAGDVMNVEGDIILKPYYSSNNRLTEGKIFLSGNLRQEGYTSSLSYENHEFILNGTAGQSIYTYNETTIANLIIQNNSVEGVELLSSFDVTGKLSDINKKAHGSGAVTVSTLNNLEEGTFGGNVIIKNNTSLTQDIDIKGILTLLDTLNLNGHTLYVGELSVASITEGSKEYYGELNVGNGKLYVEGNMTVQNAGKLIMQGANGYIKVCGDFTMSSVQLHEGLLTHGTLEIMGNFLQTTAVNFVASDNHVTRLAGKILPTGEKEIQTVELTHPDEVRFNTLVLTRILEKGYVFNCDAESVCNRIIYDIPDEHKVGDVGNLKLETADIGSITISYTYDVGLAVSGYEIYRDGVLVGVTSEQTYTDKGLIPSSNYTYTVYAFDEEKNRSENSQELNVRTLDDTTPPTEVDDLSVISRTGASITLGWGASQDDYGIAYYNIYRDGELIQSNVMDTKYCDSGLSSIEEYKYEVRAVDKAGNESNAGNQVLTVVQGPEVKSITLDKNIINGNVRFKVLFANQGSYENNTVKLEYKNTAGEWETIKVLTAESIYPEGNYLCVSYEWDSTMLAVEGDYTIRVTATDKDGCSDVMEKQFLVDNVAPDKVTGTYIKSVNGIINLNWEVSVNADCVRYNVYRVLTNESRSLVAVINDRQTTHYEDCGVKTGIQYSYVITAVDEAGNESEASKVMTVTVQKDEEKPIIEAVVPSGEVAGSRATIKVLASDNKGVCGMSLYYSTDGVEWQLIEEKNNKSNEITFLWDTKKLIEGEYKLLARAYDEEGNVSEETQTSMKTLVINHEGPENVANVNAAATAGTVRLTWDAVSAEDFDYFVVEQLVNGAYQEIHRTGNSLFYVAGGLTPNTEYTFRVVAYDNLGNRGAQGESVTVTTLQDESAPLISFVDVKGKETNGNGTYELLLSLKATDDIGIEKGIFSISTDGITFTNAVEVNAYGSKDAALNTSMDVSAYGGQTIFIKYETHDTSGNTNRLTEETENGVIREYYVDNVAPGKVLGLKVLENEGSVELTWDAALEEDFKEYYVYRVESQTGIVRRIGKEIYTNSYIDTNVTMKERYEYYVAAVDMCGNVGEPSESVFAMVTEDKTAPIIRGLGPVEEVIGRNPIISVIVTDNALLSTVRISYKNLDEPHGTYHTITTWDVNVGQFYDTCEWNTEGLASGNYEVKAEAVDLSGNSAQIMVRQYYLDNEAPTVPNVTVTPGNYKVTVAMDENTEEDFSYYEIVRRQAGETEYETIYSTVDREYVDTQTTEIVKYYYKVISYDNCGNASESAVHEVVPLNVDDVRPKAMAVKYVMGLAGYEVLLDGSASADNVGIVSYEWNLGDGNTSNGSRTRHTYEKAGTYGVTLTVTDASGNTDTVEVVVDIKNPGDYGMTGIHVMDLSGNPLPDATVFVMCGESEYTTLTTDSVGEATLVGAPGEYNVMVYSGGYLPQSKEVSLNTIGMYELNFYLEQKNVVIGDINVRKLTLWELIDEGVDLNDPANLHQFSFTLTLGYVEKPGEPLPPIWVNATGKTVIGGEEDVVNGGISWVDEDGDRHYVIPGETPDKGNMGGAEPVLYYLHINDEISWLKDMYEVEVAVLNSANRNFTLENAKASITLPTGVSLAATNKGQSPTIDMGAIEGYSSHVASWIVKGDESGTYDIGVNVSADLMPFKIPIKANFASTIECEVLDNKGITIVICPEEKAYIGKNYFIQYMIKNGTTQNLYNFRTTLGTYAEEENYHEIQVISEDGNYVVSSLDEEVPKIDPVTGEEMRDPKTGEVITETVQRRPQIRYESNAGAGNAVITHGGDTYRIDTLYAGQVMYGTHYFPFPNLSDTEKPEEIYYELVEAFVENISDENMNVHIEIVPMRSHISRNIYYETMPSDTVADPIDTRTGAFVENKTAIRVSGAKAIELNMSYNSMITDAKGELGYGWNHDYESYIENQNGQLILTMTPGRELIFLSDEMTRGIVYGELLEDNTIVIDPEHRYTGRFSCVTYGMEECYIERFEDGSYDLHTANDDVFHYDSDGKLESMCDLNGNKVTLSRNGNETIFTDVVSGAALTMVYNEEGQIIEARDNLGNKVTFAYENGCLTRFTDQMGNVKNYAYDEQNRIVGVSVNGKVVAENIYDEEGRVTSQTSEDGVMGLSYVDTDESHTVMITEPLGNQVTYVMDSRYNLLSETDANGNTWSYTYDLNNNVTKEVDPQGNITSYVYDKNGNQSQVTTANGNVTRLEADAKGNITKVSSLERIQTFTYDEQNRLIRSEAENGKVETYEYDAAGHLIRHTIVGSGSTTYGYTNGRITSITDVLGNTSRMEYNEAGWMTKSIDAMGNVTTYEYNEKGYNERITDPMGNVASYEYDPSGNVTKAVNALGEVTTSTYDDAGRQTSVTDVMGNTTHYIYDGAGNLIRTDYADGTSASATYDGAGNQLTGTDILGQTTTYTYDSLSRLIRITDYEGLVTTYEYDCMNRVTRITAADGTHVDYEYDANGNCICEVASDGSEMRRTFDCHNNCTSMTDYCGVTMYYTYDESGRMLTVTDGNGNITRYAYDAAGRCIGQTSPNGTHVKMTYDALGRMTSVGTVTSTYGEVAIRYEYDALGNVTKTIDEMGNVSICEYDALGRLIRLKDEDGNVQAEYTYDAAGNLLTETDSEGNTNSYTYSDKTYELISLVQNVGSDTQATYTYEYDVAGRIIKVTDPMEGVTSQTYDSSGNVASVTDPNGGTTTYEYDRMGRITEICNAIGSKTTYTYDSNGVLQESTNARNQTTTYEYDKNGRITKLSDEAGTISYYYDNNGNVLTVTELLPDGTSNTIKRTYDCMNRVSSYTDYKGNTINYGYDELGNLITLTYAGGEIIRYAYYPNGWIKSVTDVKGNITSYEYDSNGNCIKTVFGDGAVETCEFDGSGNLTVQETKNAIGAVLSRYEYGYDENGNVVETKGIEAGDLTRVTVAKMSYDEANRLITYNSEDVLYDADGNMTYGPLDGVMTEFTYDCRNRLISAGNTAYEYDAENVRIAVNTPEYRDEYLVNKNSELTQILTVTRYQTDGVCETTTYTYGRGLVSQYTEKRGCEYYHYNNIGSTTYLTKNGVVTRSFAYGTYGELTMGEYGDIRFMYNGRFGVVTDENGLYQMRARYYNPVIRRFINQDILMGDIANSQSLNRYSYCQGNPVSYLDPFGLSPYNAYNEMGHALLNFVSFIPIIGDIADTINSIWYLSEGNYAEAMICAIGVLPFVGDIFSKGFKWTKVGRGIKFAANVGKVYLGGSGAWQNLENIRTMMANGTGQWYDYLWEGTMFLLNAATCFIGAAGVVDDLSQGVKYLQKMKIQSQMEVRSLDGGYLVTPKKQQSNISFENGYDLQFFASKKGNNSHLSNHQANRIKNEIVAGNDVELETLDDALEIIEKKFPEFKQEVAGNRSSEGWHFDCHPINGSIENIEHINIYSKSQKFRVHITWKDE